MQVYVIYLFILQTEFIILTDHSRATKLSLYSNRVHSFAQVLTNCEFYHFDQRVCITFYVTILIHRGIHSQLLITAISIS